MVGSEEAFGMQNAQMTGRSEGPAGVKMAIRGGPAITAYCGNEMGTEAW
jgi:hypothetical protein